jgi:r1t holin
MNNLSAFSGRLIGEQMAASHEPPGPMRKLLRSKLFKSTAIRAGRTFLQTFLAVMLATPVLNVSGPTLKAAGIAGFASVLSMVHRLLDETPVPSLADKTEAAPLPAPAAATVGAA